MKVADFLVLKVARIEHIQKINCEVARKQDYLVVLRMCVANSYKLCNKKDFEITWKLINNTYTEFKKGRPNKWENTSVQTASAAKPT